MPPTAPRIYLHLLPAPSLSELDQTPVTSLFPQLLPIPRLLHPQACSVTQTPLFIITQYPIPLLHSLRPPSLTQCKSNTMKATKPHPPCSLAMSYQLCSYNGRNMPLHILTRPRSPRGIRSPMFSLAGKIQRLTTSSKCINHVSMPQTSHSPRSLHSPTNSYWIPFGVRWVQTESDRSLMFWNLGGLPAIFNFSVRSDSELSPSKFLRLLGIR